MSWAVLSRMAEWIDAPQNYLVGSFSAAEVAFTARITRSPVRFWTESAT